MRQIKTSQSADSCGNFAKAYHSEALLYFVKEILNVIPLSIFSTYAMIVEMNQETLYHGPTNEDIENSSHDDNYKRAKLTYDLSVLTKGKSIYCLCHG
jgi:hypothetical protein